MSNSRNLLFMLLCSLIFLFSIFSTQVNAFIIYTQAIIINNTQNSNTLTDYQVLITMDTASLISQGKMRSDCGDIRFTDSDGSTLLNYWIESGCNSNSTRIWVKIPQIPASSTKTIYVYYGNPSAVSASNGTATFDFFDDLESFNGWSLGGTWYIVQCPNRASKCFLNSDNGQAIYTSKSLTGNIEIIADIYHNWTNIVNGVDTGAGIQNLFLARSGDSRQYWCLFNSTNNIVLAEIIGLSQANVWHTIVVDLNGTHVIGKFYEGNNLEATLVLPQSSSNSGKLYLYAGGDGSNRKHYFDFVRVRKYASPEPNITFISTYFYLSKTPNYIFENNYHNFFINISFNNSLYNNATAELILNNQTYQFNLNQIIDNITYVFSKRILIPILNITNLNYTSNLTISIKLTYLNGTTKTDYYNTTIPTYKLFISNCTAGVQTYQYFLKDELNRSSITQDNAITNIKITMPDGETQQQFILSNTTNLCIYPAFVAVNATISAQFSKSSYSSSEDIIQTTILSNQSQSKTVYLLPSSSAQAITFKLPDQDFVIYAERLYGDGYTYVKSSKADFNKNAILYLQPYDTYYRIKVFKDDASLCYQTSDFKIASTTYSISTCNVNVSYPPPQIFYVKNVNVSCGFDNTTKNLTCTFTSTDGFDHDVNLIIYKQNKLFNNTVYYNNTLHGTSGTFIVNLQDGFYYSYILTAHSVFDYFSSFVNLASRVAEAGINYIFLIAFIFAALLGFIKPEFGILSIVLLIFISAVIGISFFEIGAIVGLIIAFGLIYFIRR